MAECGGMVFKHEIYTKFGWKKPALMLGLYDCVLYTEIQALPIPQTGI